MKYSTIFLDFDDTLIDTQANSKKFLHETYDEYNIDQYFPSFDAFYNIYTENNLKLWDDYSKGVVDKTTLLNTRFTKPFEQFSNIDDLFIQEISEGFMRKILKSDTYICGAKELLIYLKSKYKLVMLSNGFTEYQYTKLESVGFDVFFDEIILSDTVGINKPHPDLFTYALNKTKCTSQEAIMIGDNFMADIEGARNSRIDQVWYNPRSLQSEWTPTFVVNELSEIHSIL